MEPQQESNLWVSWNGNIKHHFDVNKIIRSEDELLNAVRNSKGKIRVFGSKQSSSDIAAGTNTIIDLTQYNKIIGFNDATKEITVQSGITLAELIEAVEEKGWAIPCLPDINTVTLGGALSTGTHGTGRNGKLLSEYMSACKIVKADGALLEVNEGEELMDALRVSLGVLGIFSEITIKCEDIYTLHVVERPMKDKVWLGNLSEMLAKYEFLRILFLPHTNHGYVITADKIDPNTEIVENKGPKYLKHRRKVSRMLYKYTVKNPRFTVIANKILYTLFFRSRKETKGSLYQATVTKSRGSTLELAEWTVGLSKFPALFKELKQELKSTKNKAYVHIPMDVRFIKQDDSWLSYAYGEDTVTVGCVCRVSDKADEYEAFEMVEKLFLKYGGRPHWGKRFKAKKETLRKIYPKFDDFAALRKEMDPTDRFLNGYLKTLFVD